MSIKVIIPAVLAVILAAGLYFVFVVAPPRVDADLNQVITHEPWPVSERAREFHSTLAVADLHADTLLWARDPREKHDYGQTDLPRFREGRMALQVFTAVTKSPSGLNYEENDSEAPDDITRLAIVQRWPRATWGSLEERAHFQAKRLHIIADVDHEFLVVKNKADLRYLMTARAENPRMMGGILGIEGAHPLQGDLAAIDRLYAEGYRLMGLQHFFDNELGGSLHGFSKKGLTEFGRQAVDEMERRGIIIDLAHSSEQVVREVLDRTERPVVISHTGVKSACNTARNISDDLMHEIANRGGLIGLGFWDEAVCDATPDGLAKIIGYSIETFGEDAVALGSDFDGSVATYFDVSELAALTDALLRAGFSESQIRKVMGGNQIRFFLEHLPEEPGSL